MSLQKNPGKVLTNAFKGLRDVVPQKVLAKLGWTLTKQANPNDIEPTALSSTIVESSCQTDRNDERVKDVLTLGGSSASFTGQQITDDLQVATVTENWGTNPTVTATATTVSGSVEDDGVGKMARIVNAPAVLALPEYISEKRSLLPELFYVGVTETTVEQTSTGAAGQPTLSGNQIRASDRQLNAFNKRSSVTTLGTVADATAYTGKLWTDQFGGGTVDHTQSKEAASTLTVDFRTVAAKAEPLGDGKFFVDYVKLPSGTWPILEEDIWDDFSRSLIHVTKQIVAIGATTSGISSGTLTEKRQLDNLHELKIVSTALGGTPSDQTLSVLVDVSTPSWFTSLGPDDGATQIDATSGYTADRGADYQMRHKQGRYVGTLHRIFSTSAPSAPSVTAFTFNVDAVHNAEAYENAGDEPYCRILYYDLPDHVGGAVTGTFLMSLQVQMHKMFYVQEYITVTI